MNKEFVGCREWEEQQRHRLETSTAWKRILSKLKTRRNKIKKKHNTEQSRRSKRLWCFVSHRLWQHKIQRNNISTVNVLFFVCFLFKSYCIDDFVCTSEKKRRKKNHSNRKAVEEHAKIACRFRYYESCSALTLGARS